MTVAHRRREVRHAKARALVAVALAAAAAALARRGDAPWPAALALASGAAAFAAWRSVAGAGAGFALMLVAALLAGASGRHDLAGLGPALPALAGLELYGPLTVAAVALVRRPRKVSRRLLGSWLASSGLVAAGLALATREGGRAAGGALLAGALAYRLGVVPAYAWAPMLLRHPSRRIASLGVLALAASAGTLALVTSRLPEPSGARPALLVLAGATLPWAAWQAAHQWRRDRACARTYGVVAAMSLVVLLLGGRP